MIKDGTLRQGEAALGPDLNASHPRRIVFMGTPELAAHILERLVAAAGENFVVAGVVTRPDQPRGRGQKQQPSEVAAVAAHMRIPDAEADQRFAPPQFLARVESLRARSPGGRGLRTHPAERRARGAAHHADQRARVAAAASSRRRADRRRDPRRRYARPASPSCASSSRWTRARCCISARFRSPTTKRTGSLKAQARGTRRRRRCSRRWKNFAAVNSRETPQDESLATYTKIITKARRGRSIGALSAAQIERMTRAYDPWPVARTTFARKRTDDLSRARGRIGQRCGSRHHRKHRRRTRSCDAATTRSNCSKCRRPAASACARGDWARGRRLAVGDEVGRVIWRPRQESAGYVARRRSKSCFASSIGAPTPTSCSAIACLNSKTNDRRLITLMVLGTLAWRGRLDFEIARLASRPLGQDRSHGARNPAPRTFSDSLISIGCRVTPPSTLR